VLRDEKDIICVLCRGPRLSPFADRGSTPPAPCSCPGTGTWGTLMGSSQEAVGMRNIIMTTLV
jgi:hypothetical protein